MGYIQSSDNYETIELFSKIDDIKSTIIKTSLPSLYFYDYSNYQEYINFKNFKKLLDNIYVEVCNEECFTFKLKFTDDYKNNRLFFNTKYDNERQESDFYFSKGKDKIAESIMTKFSKKNDAFFKKIVDNDSEINITYFESSNTIVMEKLIDNSIVEEWYYDLTYDSLHYFNNVDSFELKYSSSDDFECIKGNCFSSNKYDLFFKILSNELK